MSVGLRKILRSREFSLFLVLVVLCIVIQSRNPQFLTATVIDSILRNYSYTILMATGMLMVLLVGGIDISVGSTLALSGMTSALLMRHGVIESAFLAYMVSLGVGILCGLMVGLVITKGKVLPIIASLGFMYVFRGMTFFISGGQWVGMQHLLPEFRAFSQGAALGISNLLWITIVVYILVFIMLGWTRTGRQIYAVGSNPEAAMVSGIRSDNIKLFVYAFNGALAGISGAMFVGFYASAQNNSAMGLELDIIAACVIGGVSLKGGQGTIPGVLLGALMIAVINRSLSLTGIDPFWQQALKGAVILIAVTTNILVQRRATRLSLARREI
ncbi:MAG: ABC transporter permease [Oscillospiraceae bacterium]|nr:ABC transporter permease [Oscillospiraceae bacterium]